MSATRKSRSDEWREYLTPEEAKIIAKSDAARKAWIDASAVRAGIVNRAVMRRRRAAEKRT